MIRKKIYHTFRGVPFLGAFIFLLEAAFDTSPSQGLSPSWWEKSNKYAKSKK